MQGDYSSSRSERGFTLVELLTTVTIISILSAIVSHQFHAYTARAMSSRAESDLRAAITAEEAFYAENEQYADCAGIACNSTLPGYLLSLDVQLAIVTRDDYQIFDANCYHPAGDKDFSYSSETGTFTYVLR